MQPVSRIESARRSLRMARIAVGAGAAAALLALTVVVRASHPASHHPTTLQTPASLESQATDSFDFGDGGSFGSSSSGSSSSGSSSNGSAPQVSSGGS